MEISLDALLGVQRHGQDLAYRLAQGVSGLLLHVQPPQLPWPAPLPHKLIPFDIELPFAAGGVDLPAVAVASFVDIGGRLGQAGSDLGASVGGAVQQLSRQIPVPFRAEGARRRKWEGAAAPPPAAVDEREAGLAAERADGGGIALEGVGEGDSLEQVAAAVAAATGSAAAASEGVDGLDEEEDEFEFEIGTLGKFMKPKIYDGFLYRF